MCEKKPQYGAAVSAISKQEDMPRYVRITDIDDNGKLKTSGIVGINENNARPYHLSEETYPF